MFRTAASRIVTTRTGLAAGRSLQSIPVSSSSISSAGARRTLFGSAKTTKKGPGPKTFKSAAVRWGLAIGGTYYYLTSSVFAEETTYYKQGSTPTYAADGTHDEDEDEDLTRPRSHRDLDDLRHHSRTTGTISDAEDTKLITASQAGTTKRPGSQDEVGGTEHAVDVAVGGITTPEELEEEADQQGAFNPETGEINWDCPCLGGMAHGPCGEEFKTAFSCFVYSTSDPKGMDCIDHFKGMQDCFRKFPDIYGAELGPEEEDKSIDEIASEVTTDEKTSSSTSPSTANSTSPLAVGQVQEKVKNETLPVAGKEEVVIEGDIDRIPVKPESGEKASTKQVKKGVSATVEKS